MLVWYCLGVRRTYIMKDKNKKTIKHRDIVKISANWFNGDKISICAIKKNPKRLWFYNPNCCKICRNGFGAYGKILELKSEEIEIIGNLDITPELLPLKDFNN